MEITIDKIRQAQQRLQEYLQPTPLILNPWLSERFACQVYLKLESLQPVGSFKIRGAVNRISLLSESEKQKGVLASSAGNHAQGVAWASQKMGVKSTIFMPVGAPIVKIENTKKLGAEIILQGRTFEETFEAAQAHLKTSGLTFIHAYKDESIIAGQGTMGLEIADELPDTDFIVGSMGGGGMMTGIGTVARTLLPRCKLIGCQAAGANPMVKALKLGQGVKNDSVHTFADGIAFSTADEVMRKLLSQCIDLSLEASDEEIAAAVLYLMEKSRLVAEGSAALPLAVLPQIKDHIKGKKVVLVISGGNIDVNLLARIIDAGLVKAGRRIKLKVLVDDQPGSLAAVTRCIADGGANVLQALHDRDKTAGAIDKVLIELTLETRSESHGRQIIDSLKERFTQVDLSK